MALSEGTVAPASTKSCKWPLLRGHKLGFSASHRQGDNWMCGMAGFHLGVDLALSLGTL